MPTLELWLSCFTNPLSMMYLYGKQIGRWCVLQRCYETIKWLLPKHMVAVVNTASDHRPHSLYAIDGERCCCNVGGHYTLPYSWRWRLKDLPLLICNQTEKDKCCFTRQIIRCNSCGMYFTSRHGTIKRQNKKAFHGLVLYIVAVVYSLSFLIQQVTGTLNLWLTCQTWRINVADFCQG